MLFLYQGVGINCWRWELLRANPLLRTNWAQDNLWLQQEKKVTLLISIFFLATVQAGGGLHLEPCDPCDSFSYSILEIKNRSKSIMWHFQGKVQGEFCLHAPSLRTLILLETLGGRGSGLIILHRGFIWDLVKQSPKWTVCQGHGKRATQFNFGQLSKWNPFKQVT